jgi:uncharacterized protein YndB with AHSA1/START domain
MTDPEMATLLEADGGVALRFVRHLAHPAEKVWRAITESEHLSHWFPADIVGERVSGAAIELRFWPEHIEAYDIEDPSLPGEILVWDPPRRFEWRWDTDVLRFDLAESEGGTTLTFTTWLGDNGHPDRQQAAGYHVCFDQLAELLDTGTVARRLVDVEVEPVQQRYAEML